MIKISPLLTFSGLFTIGLVALSIIGCFLGVMHLLHWQVVLLCFLLLIAFSDEPIKFFWISLKKTLGTLHFWKLYENWIYLGILSLASGLVISLWVLNNGLYPHVFDIDVYETYLPYFRQVLWDGHVGPNEFGTKFYEAKGFGLAFLIGLLTNFVSANLASLLFVMCAAMGLGLVIHSVTKNISLGILFVFVFFSSLLILEHGAGYCFKGHALTLSTLSFIFISLYFVEAADSPGLRQLFMFCGGISSFYYGYALPMPLIVPFTFLPLLSIVYFVVYRPSRLLTPPTVLLFWALFGLITDFIVNYIFTGMIEVAPQRLLWKIGGNTTRYLEIFGSGTILYGLHFTGAQEQFIRNASFDKEYIAQLIHAFRLNLYPTLLRGWGSGESIDQIAVFACSLIGLLPGFFLRNIKLFHCLVLNLTLVLSICVILFFLSHHSLFRMFILCITPLVLTQILGLVVGLVIAKNLIVLYLFRYLKPKIKTGMITVFTVAIVGFFMSLFTRAIFYQWQIEDSRFRHAVTFFIGGMPYSKALVIEYPPEAQKDFSIWLKIKNLIGKETKVHWSTYFAHAGILFPGIGAVADPVFSFGPGSTHLDIIYGEPGLAKQLLVKRGWNYFLINPTQRLMSGLPLSKLFSEKEIGNYLGVLFQEGDYYLLTWKSNPNIQAIPSVFFEKFKKNIRANRGRPDNLYDDPERLYRYLKGIYD